MRNAKEYSSQKNNKPTAVDIVGECVTWMGGVYIVALFTHQKATSSQLWMLALAYNFVQDFVVFDLPDVHLVHPTRPNLNVCVVQVELRVYLGNVGWLDVDDNNNKQRPWWWLTCRIHLKHNCLYCWRCYWLHIRKVAVPAATINQGLVLSISFKHLQQPLLNNHVIIWW